MRLTIVWKIKRIYVIFRRIEKNETDGIKRETQRCKMKKVKYYLYAIRLLWDERHNANCRAKWRRVMKKLEAREGGEIK